MREREREYYIERERMSERGRERERETFFSKEQLTRIKELEEALAAVKNATSRHRRPWERPGMFARSIREPRIRRLRICGSRSLGDSLWDLGIPPLEIKNTIASNSLKARSLVCELTVITACGKTIAKSCAL